MLTAAGKRHLGRPRRRQEDNIGMDLKEIGINWIDLAEDRDYWIAYGFHKPWSQFVNNNNNNNKNNNNNLQNNLFV